jgi:hypothetical protein
VALWRSKGAREDATRGTAPIEVRKSDALLFSGVGVLPGSASPLVTGTSGWTYAVGKAGFVTSRGESDGVHLFGNDGVVNIGATGAGSLVPVAPGAGLSRIDVIWVRHPAAGENADMTSEPVFGVTSGTAASSPVAPTIPTGALELGRNTMTSAATSTNSTGNSITNTAPQVRSRLEPPAPEWQIATPASGWSLVHGSLPVRYQVVDGWLEARGVLLSPALAAGAYSLAVTGIPGPVTSDSSFPTYPIGCSVLTVSAVGNPRGSDSAMRIAASGAVPAGTRFTIDGRYWVGP